MANSERDSYLLGGRRVAISDLLQAGLLEHDADLVFKRPRIGALYKATVQADGRLQLEDGRSFNSPSRAAVAAAGGSLDGWRAWQVASTGEMLDALRQRLLDDADRASVSSANHASNFSMSRHEFLKEARQRASSGSPLELTVRDLIAKWDASGRGQVISARIVAELDNHGLATVPHFLKVGLDSPVKVKLQPIEQAIATGADSSATDDESLPFDTSDY